MLKEDEQLPIKSVANNKNQARNAHTAGNDCVFTTLRESKNGQINCLQRKRKITGVKKAAR